MAATVTVELEMLGTTPTTDEVTWVVPANTDKATFCAIISDIKMCSSSGMAAPYTIPTNEDLVMTDYVIVADTLYFTGLKGAKLGIIYHST